MSARVNNPARVFVSHSHKDDAFTKRLVRDLRAAGADVWVDIVNIDRGDFLERIDEALSSRDWLILVLTPDALHSRWVRIEVNAAINLVVQGRMHAVIPVLARPCNQAEIPAVWSTLHYYDAVRDYSAALSGLLHALGTGPTQGPAGTKRDAPKPGSARPPSEHMLQRLASLGFARRETGGGEVVIPPMCKIPAGPFLMGTDPNVDKIGDPDEQPQHTVLLPTYFIGRFPVTVAEYACFVRTGGDEPRPWENGGRMLDWREQIDRLDHPVVCITWQNAVDYCSWLAVVTGDPWKLVSEAEWEKAARWDEGARHSRIYPWGDTFEKSRCNTLASGVKTTTPVGSYPDGVGPYGADDMAGNVWSWTRSHAAQYPYDPDDGRESLYSRGNRVIRGGSWLANPRNARSAFRDIVDPDLILGALGFRLVLDAASQ